jgi:hypothetical protein
MNFLIADTFTAFARLSGADQKAVKASVFDLQMDRKRSFFPTLLQAGFPSICVSS